MFAFPGKFGGSSAVAVLFFGVAAFGQVYARCQIPCGIYGDHVRVQDHGERPLEHHSLIVAVMKAKQNTDAKYADAAKAVEALASYYPEQEH